MLKFHNFDIVCQEIPDEVTLAVNITGCPNHCPGCHSKWLWDDAGTPLDADALDNLLRTYGSAVTCLCFMGGDQSPAEVEALSRHARAMFPTLKTAWYSGRKTISADIDPSSFHFIKIGPYIASLGPLKSSTTNQRLYAVAADGSLSDITDRFWKKQ